MSERWFTVRDLGPWRRLIVDMHTRQPDGSVLAEPVGRYWSARRAAGLANVLNVMQRNGGKL